MSNRLPLEVGQAFGRLTVLEVRPPASDATNRQLTALVKCSCGATKTVRASNLLSGTTSSCGCYHRERVKEANTKHGHRHDGSDVTPTYEAWRMMVKVCSCPTTSGYVFYGAQGVTVCNRWLEYDGFSNFLSDMGEKPPGRVLSRRDKSIGYTPENTYWTTLRETSRNKVGNTFYTIGGVTKCLVDWAADYNIPKSTLHYRVVTKGMTMRDALDVGRGTCGRVLPT